MNRVLKCKSTYSCFCLICFIHIIEGETIDKKDNDAKAYWVSWTDNEIFLSFSNNNSGAIWGLKILLFLTL